MLNFRQCGASSSNHHWGHYLFYFFPSIEHANARECENHFWVSVNQRDQWKGRQIALVASILNIFASKLGENESMFDEQIFEVG